jgi:hypothetical protein
MIEEDTSTCHQFAMPLTVSEIRGRAVSSVVLKWINFKQGNMLDTALHQISGPWPWRFTCWFVQQATSQFASRRQVRSNSCRLCGSAGASGFRLRRHHVCAVECYMLRL